VIKPISCPKCKRALGWYDTNTGCLQEFLPRKVFGAYLACENAECDVVYKFDGAKFVKKAKIRDRRAVSVPEPEQKQAPSIVESITSGLQNLKLAFEG
jgi:hypothetical protein